jgi:DUF4097 and DUF4098 domain-containing protein YvlB
MNSTIPIAALVMCAGLSSQAAAGPKDWQRHSMGISGDGHGPVADCSGLHIQFDGQAAAIRSEERSIPKSQGPLKIESEVNGGMQLQGWDQDKYSVTVCKAVDASGNDAEQMFSQIALWVENGRVSVNGPSGHNHWSAYLLVKAPKGADIELEAKNGPVSIYDLDAKLRARTKNGPLSVRGFSGEADIEAQNGPVDLDGNSGKLRLHTENGPISVTLQGHAWQGAGLEADAKNGPLTLRLPQNYQSGVLVESSANAPMSCEPSVCGDARKTWDEDYRRMEFGASPAAIHVSTVNGPVSVRQASDKL